MSDKKSSVNEMNSIATDESSKENNELADSFETLMPVLEESFGSHAGSVSTATRKRMFSQLQLQLLDASQRNPRSCVDDARAALMERENHAEGLPERVH